jgi:hypothetical protein
VEGAGVKEACSFLKKRTKKLLFAVADFPAALAESKSFLLLFFKKDVLFSLLHWQLKHSS